MKKQTKTLAELQAEKKALELDIRVQSTRTDAASKAEVTLKTVKLEACEANIELAEGAELKAAALKAKGEAAYKAMVAAGEAPAQDENRKTELMAKFTDPEHGEAAIDAYAGPSLRKQSGATGGSGGAKMLALTGGRIAPVAGALTAVDGRINRFALDAASSYSYEFANGFSPAEAIAGYAELQAANTACGWNTNDHIAMDKKRDIAIAAANWYKAHLAPNVNKWEHIPGWSLQHLVKQDGGLSATDYTSGTLGTLSGTLVIQRSLPTFAYDYPELLAMYTDFADTPGLYKQTETTRIVVQLAAVKYDTTQTTTGVPNGWIATGVTGTTVDASITLSDYIGVPILVNNAVLASTTRRLFDEQGVLAIKSIAAYFTGMATDLMTMANYKAYATTTTSLTTYGGAVPIAYPSYSVNSGTFAVSDLDKIHAAFSSMKVPRADRAIMLNPTFYAKLRSDPRFYFLYMGAAKTIGQPGDFLGEALLPRISGFAPYEAPYLPTGNPVAAPTTTNVAGFAFHKAGVILKSRLPVDFTQSVNAMVPGSVTTVTDPDTKISVMLVQFVDLTRNFAEWRPEVILGAAVGDFRGGMVLTGQ